jgi:hypothetical protein
VINERLRDVDSYDQDIILADWHSWVVMNYYINTHPTRSHKYADIRKNVLLVRPGSANSVRVLHTQLARTQYLVSNQKNDNFRVRVWVVVTKLDRFSSIANSPFVMENLAFQKDFETVDDRYRPRLFELRLTKAATTQ